MSQGNVSGTHHPIVPLPLDPRRLDGISERMILSHHENNYGGAVKNLNKVEEELSRLRKDTPGFVVAGLKERELTFTNSMILHEHYFGNLGGDGKPSGIIEKRLAAEHGSFARWEELFRATGASLSGGSGWAILNYNFQTSQLRTYWSGNHTQSVAFGQPLLVLDMYEHSYHMDYGAAARETHRCVFQKRQLGRSESPPGASGQSSSRPSDQMNREETNQMGTKIGWILVVLAASASVDGATPKTGKETKLNTAQIEQLTGVKGSMNEKEGVFKVSVPRSDLAISTAGVKMTPPMGLTSWAAFERNGNATMVMGDMVLTEDQVNPAMSTALENGLEVTALHNHFFWDSPKVMFMHIGGMGDEAKLAAAVGKLFANMKQTSGGKGEVPHAEIDPANTSLDPKKIETILGTKGDLANGVYKVTIGRETKMHGHTAGNAMGVNTWAAFAGSDDKAVVDGDFAMLESELQPVLKALRGAGINIVAIHQHMAGEVPRVLFLHFWGVGPTESLAKGVKAALDTQKPSHKAG